MPRRNLLLTLAYDGTDFAGWQRGPAGSRTVQAVVESALGGLLGEELEIVGASRTDAGVHAEGQAASFHSRSGLSPEAMAAELGLRLPPDVACLSCREVDPRFHARYRAKGKLYRYRLHVGACPDPFVRRYSLHVAGGLDIPAMKDAAAVLVGSHDFSAFTNARGVEDGSRRLDRVEVLSSGPFLDLLFRGDSFMYNQVRIMAAALLEAGQGRLKPPELARALETGRRPSMPGALGPFGLCLLEVFF